jgi:hypothetical protein
MSLMKAQEPRPVISTALTVTQFCQMFDIEPELYAALKRTGQGPREVRIGHCIVIPSEYAAQWLVKAEPLQVFAQRYLCG